jgi:hypothetical protein
VRSGFTLDSWYVSLIKSGFFLISQGGARFDRTRCFRSLNVSPFYNGEDCTYIFSFLLERILRYFRCRSDRIGRRPVIFIGLSGSVAAIALFGISKDLAWALTSRTFGQSRPESRYLLLTNHTLRLFSWRALWQHCVREHYSIWIISTNAML